MLSILYVYIYFNLQSIIRLLDHIPNIEETTETSQNLLDELIHTIQTKNNHLKQHLNQENQAMEDLISKK